MDPIRFLSAASAALVLATTAHLVSAEPDSLAGPRRTTLGGARERAVWENLDETARSIGLGRGELLSAAESSEARAHLPRAEGTATVTVDVDANGVALGANVTAVSGDREAWERVARALVGELVGKRVRAARGPFGTRFTLELVHRDRYPSGNRHVIALCPPGTGMGAALGAGITICFDPVDLFAHRSRRLAARIVGEGPLPPPR